MHGAFPPADANSPIRAQMMADILQMINYISSKNIMLLENTLCTSNYPKTELKAVLTD